MIVLTMVLIFFFFFFHFKSWRYFTREQNVATEDVMTLCSCNQLLRTCGHSKNMQQDFYKIFDFNMTKPGTTDLMKSASLLFIIRVI